MKESIKPSKRGLRGYVLPATAGKREVDDSTEDKAKYLKNLVSELLNYTYDEHEDLEFKLSEELPESKVLRTPLTDISNALKRKSNVENSQAPSDNSVTIASLRNVRTPYVSDSFKSSGHKSSCEDGVDTHPRVAKGVSRDIAGNIKEHVNTDTDSGLHVENAQVSTLQHESGAKKQIKKKYKETEETKQTKTVTGQSKMVSLTKGLADGGSKWVSDIRRSTRIRSTPLKYWRGERFLFGRIHESLATVIGIKYESPGNDKGGNRVLKVKSFVSDDYKELLDLAAQN